MHFSRIAISSLLVGASIAKPVTNVARQEADLPSVPDLGALPEPTGLFPELSKRQGGDGERGVDAVPGVGNRVGGPPEGSGNGNGSGGRDDGSNRENNPPMGGNGLQGEENGLRGVDAVPGVGNREGGPPEGQGNGRGGKDDNNMEPPPPPPAQETPPPPPPAAMPPPPMETQKEPPKPEQTQAMPPPPPPPPMGDKGGKGGAPSVLPPDVQAKMMPLVWALGPVTQLKPGLGAMGQVLPKINNVDSKMSL